MATAPSDRGGGPGRGLRRGRKKGGGSKISNAEWVIVLILLGIVDLVQFALDWIGIPYVATVGMIANRLISWVMGILWPTYLWLRGVRFNTVRVFSFILSLFIKEIPDIDSFPTWVMEGLYIKASLEAEKLIEKTTGVDIGQLDAIDASGMGAAETAAEGAGALAAAGEGGAEGTAETGGEEAPQNVVDLRSESRPQGENVLDLSRETAAPAAKAPDEDERRLAA